MNFNFDAEMANGSINFKGTLTKEEVDFLLRFALLHLLARGALPMTEATLDKPETMQ